MMTNLIVKEKSIVVPGEILAEGMDNLPGFGTYRADNRILASRLGIIVLDGRALKIIPVSGCYNPKTNDVIIGKVIDVTMSGWRIDTNSAYTAMLMLKDGSSEYIARGADLTSYYQLGDYVVCKIIKMTSQRLIDLTMKGPGLKKLKGGRIVNVNPYKVPRIIGKQGSMVTMVKQATNCQIIVGQNGLIWLLGEPEDEALAVKTIKKIEAESHHPGLTEKIKAFLDKNARKGGSPAQARGPVRRDDQQEASQERRPQPQESRSDDAQAGNGESR
jgi:exosome complex component RRP4